MNKHDNEYHKRYDKMLKDVDSLFDDTSERVSRAASNAGIKPDDVFKLASYPAVSRKVDGIISDFGARLNIIIKTGVTDVWGISNLKNDEMLTGIFGDSVPKVYAVHNLDALDAFLNVKRSGMTTSERVWNIQGGLRSEMERCIDAAIADGKGAPELARDIKKYLRNPDMLFRRIRDKNGELQLSSAAKDYHPGIGVYRSSYQNALRLARTELNKAYRKADWLRWQSMDFVVGYEIVTSRSIGVCELCSTLEGSYPKNFYFEGWHPACRCVCIPIFASEDPTAILDGDFSDRQPPLPGVFSAWVTANSGNIARKAPQFIEDNMKYVKFI